jgi:hypothetical protein
VKCRRPTPLFAAIAFVVASRLLPAAEPKVDARFADMD